MKNLWLFEKHRLEILLALTKCRDHLCGCDISKQVKMPKNLASYHLKLLEEKGIVEAEKDGRMKRYRISSKQKALVTNLLKVVNQ